jgi:hypothetical protein
VDRRLDQRQPASRLVRLTIAHARGIREVCTVSCGFWGLTVQTSELAEGWAFSW